VQLRQEVAEMRTKMRDNLDKSNTELFDLKQGFGGMTDIEFIAQYQVLRWAADYPHLVETTGVLPLFKLLENQALMMPLAVQQLSEAYRIYRAEIHRLTLQNQPTIVTHELLKEQRQWVTDWWHKIITI
jgi:glutamate-ammonia-ligase adenylyltransferase